MKDEQGAAHQKTKELMGKGGRDAAVYKSDVGGGAASPWKKAKLDGQGECGKKDASAYSGCESVKPKGQY
jgi:hypothetical protein